MLGLRGSQRWAAGLGRTPGPSDAGEWETNRRHDMDLVLCSTVADVHRDELERLLFFNARQPRVRTGLIEALERFGTPAIEHHANLLRVTPGAGPDAQCLFAVSETDGLSQLLGVVVYVRTSMDTLTVLHVAVADNIVT